MLKCKYNKTYINFITYNICIFNHHISTSIISTSPRSLSDLGSVSWPEGSRVAAGAQHRTYSEPAGQRRRVATQRPNKQHKLGNVQRLCLGQCPRNIGAVGLPSRQQSRQEPDNQSTNNEVNFLFQEIEKALERILVGILQVISQNAHTAVA